MSESRLEALRKMVEARPKDARVRFGLALEHERLGHWAEVVEELRTYLSLTRDEGNAYGRLARALRKLGRDDEARQAYAAGIDAARAHGHPTLAVELEEEAEEMDGGF